MKYVKILGKDYNDVLRQLKLKYGDEAIPISHKHVKIGGIMNSRLFGKDMVELTAAIPERKKASAPVKAKEPMKSTLDIKVDNELPKNIYTQREIPGDSTAPYSARPTYKPAPVKNDKPESEPIRMEKNDADSFSSLFDELKTQPEKEKPNTVEINKDEFDNYIKIKNELHDMKLTFEKFMKEQKNSASHEEMNENLKPYQELLKKNDFDDSDCEKMMKEMKNSLDGDDIKDKVKIEKTLRDLLKSKIVTAGPIKVGSRKKIIMFVGPTGVGKTTTLAKIGALLSLREEKKVAFITIDTYRIAATEQLKKYAEIMNIPIHVVNDQKEFKSVIDKEKSDVILVDTSGRSHRNQLKISEIKSYADQVDYDFEKVLCVSAATKKADAESIFKSFEVLNCDSIIITKVDESSFVGNIVDIADKYNKPISYIANGQEVPNDIFAADSDKIVEMMVVGTDN